MHEAVPQPGDPATIASGARTVPPRVPASVGPYRVIRVLGEGGMGIVYLAEQTEPVQRQVAVKVVRSGLASERLLQRFEFERQALAAMSHSTIAKVLDAGTTERGDPYFVMECVEGTSLTTHCDQAQLTVRERLDLFVMICEGVHHAHQKGVIHRDLKPGNILVVREGARAVPKILDFGVAKAMDVGAFGQGRLTIEPQVLGTPEYMSPEQAAFDGAAVDTRSDVYSLGCILFELLTGRVPFPLDDGANWLEYLGRLRDQDPPLPSTRVTQHELARSATTRVIVRELRGDLDWIVVKALAKAPADRYSSAAEFAADIGRYMRCEPVLAGPPSTGYRLRKFLRRRRGLVASVGIVALTLIAGIISTSLLLIEVDAKANEAWQNLSRFQLLANVIKLDEALAEAATLFPAWPDRAPAMEHWLRERAEPLERALPELRRTRDTMASAAGPLEQKEEQFLRQTLGELVTGLENFTAPETGTLAAVRERLRWANDIVRRSQLEPAAAWQAARDALCDADGETASAFYAKASLELAPQLGLVPLGMNPNTRLWEFYHLRSAADPDVLPARRDDGEFACDEATGIIFVLLPPGAVTIAEQSVDVAPFFLGKHEVTQGQWARLSRGPSPNYYANGFKGDGMSAAVNSAHPVESVDWQQCEDLLARHGLVLPHESQWQHGCRAGSSTTWFTGDTAESLAGFANVGDKKAGAVFQWQYRTMPFDDGWVVHAPVGSLAPNAFGLFDTLGNVWEWCRNKFDAHYGVCRGGAFSVADELTTCDYRYWIEPKFRDATIGLRAARIIDS